MFTASAPVHNSTGSHTGGKPKQQQGSSVPQPSANLGSHLIPDPQAWLCSFSLQDPGTTKAGNPNLPHGPCKGGSSYRTKVPSLAESVRITIRDGLKFRVDFLPQNNH